MNIKKVTKYFYYLKSSGVNPVALAYRFIKYKLFFGLNLILGPRVVLKGCSRISTLDGNVFVGVKKIGFQTKFDVTLINCGGKLELGKGTSIGRGCRLDIGENAVVRLGENSSFNLNCLVIIMHGLTIGENCKISWNCQFLDEYFHALIYEKSRVHEKNNKINIGNHVWIGSNVFIYKGVMIADDCVVAANSVVRGLFLEKGCLIAGNPAKVVKHGVNWE